MPVYAGAATPAVTTPVYALVTSPDVFITEFQTNGGSASQEFIELYNATDQDIVFGDAVQPASEQWKIQFFNSTAVKSGTPTWTTSASTTNAITLSGTISAHDYFIIASSGYQPGGTVPGLNYTASSSHLMTDTGGGLQLISTRSAGTASTTPEISVHDRVMWLDAAANLPLPAGVLASPASGKSLQRLPDADGGYVGTDEVLTAFSTSTAISPLDAWQAPAPPVVSPPAAPENDGEPAGPAAGADGEDSPDPPVNVVDGRELVPPQLSELLPNPGSPLTDAADEYIELYNPGDHDFVLKGYSLEVGTTTLHKYVFPDSAIIPAGEYLASYSADTGLALSNSGGQAHFRDPAGTLLNETAVYGTAAENQSWSMIDGAWKWSTSLTPGAGNKLGVPVAVAKTAKATAAKIATTKKAATAKTAAAKTAKPKAAKKAKAKTAKKKKVKKPKTAALATSASLAPKPPIHSGILVAVAVAAVLYGLYEYRHDISDKFRQFKENRRAGRPRGGQAEGRRGYSAG